MKKLKKEKKGQQKSQNMYRGTNINAISVEKPNVVINEVVSMEEPPKFETKIK
jgi:hypothetical protein